MLIIPTPSNLTKSNIHGQKCCEKMWIMNNNNHNSRFFKWTKYSNTNDTRNMFVSKSIIYKIMYVGQVKEFRDLNQS